jgi:hypothetical protein
LPKIIPKTSLKPAQNHPRSTQNQLTDAEIRGTNPAQNALKKQLKNPEKIHCISGCSAPTLTTHYEYSAYAKSRNRGSGSQAKFWQKYSGS